MEEIYIKATVAEYLAQKERDEYIEATELESQSKEVKYLEYFDSKTRCALLKLRDKYGVEYIKHLDEVLNPSEVNFSINDVVKIDLDNPRHLYYFTRHELREGGLIPIKVSVELSDAEYTDLLCLCLTDCDMNFNKLRYANHSLYSLIIDQVDYLFSDDVYYDGDYPYLLTMDEASEDAMKIRALHPELDSQDSLIYHLYNTDCALR